VNGTTKAAVRPSRRQGELPVCLAGMSWRHIRDSADWRRRTVGEARALAGNRVVVFVGADGVRAEEDDEVNVELRCDKPMGHDTELRDAALEEAAKVAEDWWRERGSSGRNDIADRIRARKDKP
jgi:hypothetical protein